MKRRFLLVFLVLSLMTLCFGGVACKKKDQGKAEGPETGIYYFDDEGDESLISLFDGDQFTFLVKEANRTGTYELSDTSLTLRFSKKEDGELKGTLSGKELRITYEGRDLRFLKKEKYEVRFESNGGSAVSAIEAINGKTIKKPQDPEKSGSVFLGWYKEENFSTLFGFESEPVYGAMTLYARWADKGASVREYQIDFDLGDGTVEHAETVGGRIVEFPKAERAGYEFAGWFVSDYEQREKLTREISADETFEEDATVYAVWKQSASGGKLNMPNVSVNESRVSWTGEANATAYRIVIQGPEGFTEINHSVGGTEERVDFANFPAGDYVIKVTAVASSTSNNSDECVRYYKNKALKRPSGFEVAEPGALVFDPVEHAQKYLIYVECGNSEHRHDPFDNGNSTYFNFQNCEMKEGGITFRVEAIGDGYATSTSRVFTYERKLDKVENLKVDDGTETLSFAPVAKAAYYEIEINGNKVLTTKTSLSLKEYPTGEIAIKVTPKTRGYLSPEASEVSFQKTRLPSPNGIAIQDDTLTWNAVDGADSYSVRINTQIFDASTTEFDLTQFKNWDSKESFRLSVMAKSSGKDSLWSEEKDVNYYAMGRSLFYEGGEVYWNYVVGATNYEVKVNDNAAKTVEKANHLAITLTQAGENTISVRYHERYLTSEWVTISVYAHTVSFETSGGTQVATKYFAAGDMIVLPGAESTSRDGYDLAGWYNVPGGAKNNGLLYNSDFYLESGDIVLYANWRNKSYEINLHYQNGSDDVVKGTVTYGEHFTLDVPTSSDGIKAFAGFYSLENGGGTQLTDEHGNSLATWANLGGGDYYAYWVDVFTFTELDSGKWSVSKGPGIDYVSAVTVPETYDGKNIDIVEGYAFMSCRNLLRVSIPDTVTTIESTAFYSCRNLESVEIITTGHATSPVYSSVDGVLIHYNTTNAKNEIAYFPIAKSGYYAIPDFVDTLPVQMFASTAITEVFIPKSVTSIEQNAFYNCGYLKRVIFEEGGTAPLTIAADAFNFCSAMTDVSLPSRLTEFDRAAFNSCLSLTTVSVEQGGSNYASVDGVLTTTSGEIVYCPIGIKGVFDVPTTISAIGNNAFKDCTSLKGINIHGNVKSIGESAFAGCTQLNNVTFIGGGMVDLTIGKTAFSGCAALVVVNFEEDCKVTEIGESAFAGCRALQVITLPKNLQKIDTSAFEGCTALVRIEFAEDGANLTIGNNAFKGCTGLREVTIPKNVTNIDGNAFLGCDYILNIFVEQANGNYADQDGVLFNHEKTEILFYPRGKTGAYTIPETVTGLNAGVFSGNRSLENITIGKNVAKIGEGAFEGCTGLTSVTFESDGVDLEIGKSAFKGCTGLTKIELPDRVKKIPESLFDGCTEITEVTFSNNLDEIGAKAFQTTKITTVSIPGTVKTIGASAFASVTTLTSVTLSDGIEEIGDGAFRKDTGITTITIPKSVKKIDSCAFEGCSKLAALTFTEGGDDELSIGEKVNGDGTGYTFSGTAITALTLPTRLKKTADHDFYNCKSLTSVSFGAAARDAIPTAKLENIGASCFEGCSALTSAVIPEGVITIEENAYKGCSNLKEITIPKSVKNTQEKKAIGNNAFDGCSALTTVTFESGADENDGLSIGSSAFNGCKALTSITLPSRLAKWQNGSEVCEGYGSNCFSGCSQLNSLTVESGCEEYCIENGLFLADNKSHLISCAVGQKGEVSVPTSVKTIDPAAFAGCTQITSVTFANGNSDIKELPVDTFKGCTALTKVEFPNGLESIGKTAFSGCTSLASEFKFPNSLKKIDEQAFVDCSGLTEAKFNDGLEEIGKNAFSGCSNLKTVEIPSSVKTIAEQAFRGAMNLTTYTYETLKNLTSLTFKDDGSAELTIGANAFEGVGISSLTLPKRLKSLGLQAFSSCSSLKTLTVSSGFSQSAFSSTLLTEVKAGDNSNYSVHNGALYNKDGTELIYYPSGKTDTTFTFNNGTTSIGANAFSGQTGGLTSIEIPNTVTSIGNYAFSSSKLTSVTFKDDGNNALTIGNYAFYATSIKELKFPSRLTSIGTYAFYNVKALEKVEFAEDSKLTTIGDRAFCSSSAENTNALTEIKIPKTVTSIGTYAFQYNTKLTKVEFEDGGTNITSLGNYVFNGCSSLTDITIPSSVKTLGTYAFQNTGITKIEIPEGVTSIPNYLFNGCANLETVTLPNGLTTIGTSAFNGCVKLNNVTIPETVKTINAQAFRGCTALAEVTLPESVAFTAASTYLFYGCSALERATLPSGATMIPNYMFQSCSNLEEVNIPETVTQIGNYAFDGCTKLANVEIPGSCTAINTFAFQGCSSLTEIVIPESVQKIGGSAFKGCSGLETVEIQDGLTTLDASAFANCTSLKNFSLPGTIHSISGNPFDGCTNLEEIGIENDSKDYTVENGILYNFSKTTLLIYPAGLEESSFTVPATVTSIGDGVFAGTKLKSITFAGELEALPNKCFQNCTQLEQVQLPKGLTKIGANAFENTKITAVKIPNTVTSIGASAFKGCSELKDLEFEAGTEVLSFAGDYAFSGCTSLTSVTLPARLRTSTTDARALGSYCFQNCTNLKEVKFDSTDAEEIEGGFRLDQYVFSGCTSLEKIELPSYLQNVVISGTKQNAIHHHAFDGCTKLSSVTFAEGTGEVSLGDSCFQNCSSLKEIKLPESVTIISRYAFSGCTGLESFDLSHITQINEHAFDGCTGIKELTIPATVTAVGKYVFTNWNSSQTINVSFAENAKPSTWELQWKDNCQAQIKYATSEASE